VGVDHHVEPHWWLPEGAAPAIADETTAASGEANAANEQGSRNEDSPNGMHEASQEHSPGPGQLAPAKGGQDSPAPAAAATKPGLAAAAYRALPKPKAKVRSKTKAKAKTKAKTRTGEGRHANLVIARLEPWSVMKFSFLISLVAWVILFVAVTLLYYALSGLGVFAAIQRTLESVTSSQQSPGVSLAAWTSASRVLGYTMLIGAVDIILITALSTIGAVIYNLVTHLGGGIEITLKETD
jgi:hypothetical protein